MVYPTEMIQKVCNSNQNPRLYNSHGNSQAYSVFLYSKYTCKDLPFLPLCERSVYGCLSSVLGWCFSLLCWPQFCLSSTSCPALAPDISCLSVPGHFLHQSLSPQLSSHKCFSNLNFKRVNFDGNFSLGSIFNTRESYLLWPVFCTIQYCKAPAKFYHI